MSLLERLPSPLRELIQHKNHDDLEVTIANSGEGTIYYFNDDDAVIETVKGELIPALTSTMFLEVFPRIIVDMGAVPKICNGADVMAPGIVKVEAPIEEKTIVIVLDVKNRRPIAVGRALTASSVTETQRQGKVIETLHYVGDRKWMVLDAIRKRKPPDISKS